MREGSGSPRGSRTLSFGPPELRCAAGACPPAGLAVRATLHPTPHRLSISSSVDCGTCASADIRSDSVRVAHRTNTRGGAIMVHKRTGAFLSTVAAACLLSGGAWAGPQSKCLVSKNKCMAKKAGSLLKCQQKAETPLKPTDPNFGGCVDKARDKFDGGLDPSKGCFEKLENKPGQDCITFN